MLLPLLMLISANTPLLSDTRLYREVANNCKNVDLENWQHPTRKVLLERGVILKKSSYVTMVNIQSIMFDSRMTRLGRLKIISTRSMWPCTEPTENGHMPWSMRKEPLCI